MSRAASEFQFKAMSLAYRGKEIFKPLNTGWIDEHVACVREYAVNIFFYVKDGTVLMIDAGYNYDRLAEKMSWLGLEPLQVHDVLITHQDTDHVGAVEADSQGLFREATVYISREENCYLTGELRRRVYWGSYKLPKVTIENEKHLLEDGEVFAINNIKIEAIPVPGHTSGHMAYLIDDAYLFTGDAIWLGPDGGYSFPDALAEDNRLAIASLSELKSKLEARGLQPKIITSHTSWTADFNFAFAHVDEVCHALRRQRPHDPNAPYDAFVEDDDTRDNAVSLLLPPVVPVATSSGFWDRTAFAYDIAMRAGGEGLEQAAAYIATFLDEHDVLLDAACGTGAFACMLAPYVGFTGACDLSRNMVSQARAKADKLGLKHVAFGVDDICDLDFNDDTFDAAVAANVLHLLPDPKVALFELKRVVRPGGLIALPNYVNAGASNSRLLRAARAVGFSTAHEWDEKSYLAFLEQSGMRVVEHRSFVAAQPLVVAICHNE